MKSSILILFVVLCIIGTTSAQTSDKTDPVIEGGKIIVELVKALSSKKDPLKDQGCKGKHADLCIDNISPNSITAYLEHRLSSEKREVVILPNGQECALQIKVGVWTYDLRVTGATQSLRKGDILIEGCNNLVMNIK